MPVSVSQLSFALLILISSSAYSQGCHSTLTLGLGSIWPPYYFNQNGQPSGIDIEIVQHIFKQANICLLYSKMPSTARALAELKKGSIDLLYGASYSKKREEFAIFTLPYRQETIRIFTRKQSNVELRNATLAQLLSAKLKVATNRGSYIGGDGLALANPDYTDYVFNVPRIDRRMKMLSHEHVDLTIEDEVAGLYYLKMNALTGIEMLPAIVYHNDISLMLNKSNISNELINNINTVIKANNDAFRLLAKAY